LLERFFSDVEAACTVAERNDEAQRRAMFRRNRRIIELPRQNDLRVHQRRHLTPARVQAAGRPRDETARRRPRHLM
jgi:hypothetical protein